MKTFGFNLAALLLLLTLVNCSGEGDRITVPEGTDLMLTLETPLSTETSNSGDNFELRSIESVIIDGQVVIPAGTVFRGTLTAVEKPGSVDQAASMTLRFDEVLNSDKESYVIYTAPITLVGKSDKDADIERVAGTTVGGAIIGGIAEGGKGAIIGAIAGAGVGGTWAVLTKGNQIVLAPGQEFQTKTIASSEMPVLTQ